MRGADLVVHCAAIAGIDTVIKSPVTTMRVNMVGLGERARGRGRTSRRSERVVCFSTSEVFGRQAFRSSETDRDGDGAVGEARWTYAVSKLAEEHLAIAYPPEKRPAGHGGAAVQRLRPGPGRRGRAAHLRRSARRATSRSRSTATARRSARGATSTTWSTACCWRMAHPQRRRASRSTSATSGRSSRSMGWRTPWCACWLEARRSASPARTMSTSSCASSLGDKARELLGFEAKVDLDEGIRRTGEFWRRILVPASAAS